MPYDFSTNGKAAQIRLRGQLTFAQHRKFRNVVSDIERERPEHVVVDLSEVDYIDAAGLGLLLVARDAVKGKKVKLTGAQGQVGRMLQVARVSDLFPN